MKPRVSSHSKPRSDSKMKTLTGIKPARRAAVDDVDVIGNTIGIKGQTSAYGREGFRE